MEVTVEMWCLRMENKCEKKENKRKVGVLMKEEQHRNVMTQKCDGGAENTINRNVAVVIKVENHINVIGVPEK